MNKLTRDLNACSEELYCGYPYLLPVMKFLSLTHWIPAPAPNLPKISDITLNNKQLVNQNVWRFNFTVTGKFIVLLLLL